MWRCSSRRARSSSPRIGWAAGLPFLARRTCSVAARSNSTCDHSRSHRVSGLASAATCAGGRLFRLASREPSRWKLRGNRRRAFRVPMCLWAVAYSGVPGAPASGAAGFSSFAARARIASFGTRFVLQLFRRDSWGATTNAKRSHDPIRNRPQRFDFSDGVMFLVQTYRRSAPHRSAGA